MANPSIFTVGGTVQAGSGIYLPRPADNELLQYCQAGEFSYVLTARQMGKSSLMVRTSESLNAAGTRTAIIDLTRLGTTLAAEQWYLGLVDELVEGLELDVDYKTWWNAQGHLGTTQRWSRFLREFVIEADSTPLVIFIDEIDTTLSLPFSYDFFATIRACYNARATDLTYRRVAFVLLGVASPSELISDNRRTPFNIGQRVDLTDFTLDEAQPLAAGLRDGPPQVLEWVFEWTNGHPYLTQRLCAVLAQQPEPPTKELVAKIVQNIFMGESGQQDNNLQFVRDMLLKRTTASVEEVLSTYEQVLSEQDVEDDERSLSKVHLKLAGLVRRTPANLLRVSNEIYARVFNLQWVREQLSILRSQSPLQSRALDWERTEKDPSFLLRGTELEDAERLLLRNELPEVRGTRAVQEFILGSRTYQNQVRRRFTISLILVAIMMLFLTVFAFWQSVEARNAQSTVIVGVQTREFAVTSGVQALQTAKAEGTRVANAQATSVVLQGTSIALQGTATFNAALAEQVILTLSTSLSSIAQSRMDINYIQGLLLGVESFRLLESNHLSEGQSPDILPPLLDQIPRGLVRNQELSSGVVRKTLYAPDGDLMVTMSNTVTLWNTEDPASPTPVTGWESTNTSQTSDVTFSNDGRLMVIGYQNGGVEVWDVSSSGVTKLTTLNDFSSPVQLAVSTDSSVLAVAGDQTIRFWDLSNPRSLQEKGRVKVPHEVSDRPMDISYLRFAPGSNSLLLSGGQDNFLRLWNVTKYAYNPPGPEGNAFPFDTELPHVAISSKLLIIANAKAMRVFFYSNNGLEFAGSYGYDNVHPGAIENLVISPDNKTLYTTGQNGVLAEWDLTDPRHMRFLQTFEGPMQNISSIALHPERNFLAAAGGTSTVAIWNLDRRNTAHFWHSQLLNEATITDVAYSPTLNLFAVGNNEGSIVFWDVADPLRIKERRKTSIGNPIRHLAFNPDETTLLMMGDFTSDSVNPRAYSRDITRLDASDNLPLFGTDTADVFAAGNHFVLGGESVSGTTSIFGWDMSGHTIVRDASLGSTECPFRDTAFTENGSLLAVASCSVQLWEFLDENLPILSRELDPVDPRGVAFNTDGTLLASANGNSTISLWRLSPNGAPQPLPPISAHAGPVTSVSISPDGKILASGGEDQDIILWDILDPESPSQRAVLKGHSSAILSGGIFFLPDGKTLISASKEEVIVWDIDGQSWIDKACDIAGRNFTQAEWGQFVGRSIPYHATCPDLPIPEN
jgi:WD40 repeat protein